MDFREFFSKKFFNLNCTKQILGYKETRLRTYIQQRCEDMGYSPEDLPEAMNDKEKWRERVRDICASGKT